MAETPPPGFRRCPRPDCGEIVSERPSPWGAHQRTHQQRGRRHWVTAKPYWIWAYQLVNPQENGPQVHLVRNEATRETPTSFELQIIDRDGNVTRIPLEAAATAPAKAEAAKILRDAAL